jgi:hypothetical protein
VLTVTSADALLASTDLAIILPEKSIPLPVIQIVQKKHTVQMIKLVLNDPGQQPFRVDRERTTPLIPGLNCDLVRPFDIRVYAWNAETPLFVGGLIVGGLDDLRVDKDAGIVSLDVSDKEPFQLADLGSRKTDSFACVHGVDHRSREVLDQPIDLRYKGRLFSQHFIAKGNYIQHRCNL